MDTWRRATAGDRTYFRLVIGERRTVQAFLEAKPVIRGAAEIELRESPPTTDPRSGQHLPVPPVVVLWIEERPVAVRVRTVVAISRFPPQPRMVSMLEADCLAAGLAVERMPEAGLWRLFAHPPRPRLAHG
jgi:hypothetical protein